MGSCGGQVVSVLAFYSIDPSSNPAKVYSFNSVNCLKRTKINKRGPIKKTFSSIDRAVNYGELANDERYICQGFGSGCGSIGRAVASDTRVLQFESSHRQT